MADTGMIEQVDRETLADNARMQCPERFVHTHNPSAGDR